MLQGYLVKVELPYGLEMTDKGKVSELIPLKVIVLATSRTEAFAMAADALAFITESNNVELRGLTIEAVYPIVGGVPSEVRVQSYTQVDPRVNPMDLTRGVTP